MVRLLTASRGRHSPRHSLQSCAAADRNPASWVFYQTAPCRTSRRYLEDQGGEGQCESGDGAGPKWGPSPTGRAGEDHLHFPLKTAISGRNFFSFSTRIFPPSLSSLLQRRRQTTIRDVDLHLPWGFSGCGLLPGQVLAAWRGPGHHVGEAHLVLGGQHGVVHVVELLLGEARKEQTLPWKRRTQVSPGRLQLYVLLVAEE